MKGVLFGLGIGPGDPELITLKAVRIIAKCPVIAYPAPNEGDSLVRQIASSFIPKNRTEIVIRTPMIPGSFPNDEVYDYYAIQIKDHLNRGRDVAILCEGDPFLYGSFMYMFYRLSGMFVTKVVPGVSSVGACAAAAGLPLVSRNQTLSIIPATLEIDELFERIAGADTIAIMKVGRHLEKVRKVLKKLGLVRSAHYVEHATMVDQKIASLGETNGLNAPYLSMILVGNPENHKR